MDFQNWVNISLQSLTIGVALSGVIGYLTIRNKSKKVAKKTASIIANQVAKDVAEKIANEYIQQNLPSILESYNLGSNKNFDVEKMQEEKNEIK